MSEAHLILKEPYEISISIVLIFEWKKLKHKG